MPPRSSENQFRAIVEAGSEIVSLLDPAGRVLFINGAPERLLGREAASFAGRSFLEGVVSEDRAAFDRLLASCLANTTEPLHQREIVCSHSNGERRTLEIDLINRLEDPRLEAIVCTARDVTLRDQSQSQLLTLDRIASMGLLTAGVAHEINNPLAAIVASLEMAALRLTAVGRGGIPGPVHAAELAEDIRAAREATDRVRQVVRDLRVFARAEEDRRSVVDLESLLDISVRIAGSEIFPRARLVKNYSKVPPVYANESRLGQVFFNLLVNAAQAMPEGKSADNFIQLTTSLDHRGRVLLEVADSGEPVPVDVRERLFAPFVTTSSGAPVGGLGLTVCQLIVQDLGGEIAYDSPPEGGNVFRVSLPPTAKSPDRVASAVVESERSGRAGRQVRRGRVLVVDDEPTINGAIFRVLSLEHSVITVTRASEALSRLRSGERFDVIFCDLMMPQMTGMDLHRELQDEIPDQAARMVFLTAGAFTVGARLFLDEVSNLRIEKPFDIWLLRAIVNDRTQR